jgi:hypothetical protein
MTHPHLQGLTHPRRHSGLQGVRNFAKILGMNRMFPTGIEADISSITAGDLRLGDGITSHDAGWLISSPHVQGYSDVSLAPGWYEIALGVKSQSRFQVRKKIELTLLAGDENPRPVLREAFAWNQSFCETFAVQLTRPVAGLRLDLRHAEGEVTLTDFHIRPITKHRITARAIREKIRLTLAYRCFGGALRRGVKMLAAGRFREFGTKMMKGLVDARVMQLGVVEVSEINGAWWRRHALPPEQVEVVQKQIDAMVNPAPVSILLPVDNLQLDAARLSAHSVRRQLYPHWHLYLVASGPDDLDHHLERILGTEPRVTILRVPKWSARADAIGQAISRCETDRILVLPPGVELTEHALFHLASQVAKPDAAPTIGCPISKGFSAEAAKETEHVWLVPTKHLNDNPPHAVTTSALSAWATQIACDKHILEEVLAYPIDDRPLLDKALVGKAPPVAGKTLWLGGDVRGLGGYDHVTYAFLKGLPSCGVDLRMHPTALVRSDLVPPAMHPPIVPRPTGQPMLVLGPPFLAPRFGLDRQTAVYTMWETNRLNPVWTPQLNEAGLIIVPSAWQRDCFLADGITCPIAVAPLGIDPVVYHPRGTFPEVCTFGTAGALGSGGLRKNAQWVVELFRQAFPTEENVRLRVKITPGSPGVETYDDPRIDVIRAVLSHTELAEWYRSLTAYVNGSFGEGFGLHLIEAMACGRPIITPNHSGLTAFFEPHLGYVVEHKLIEAKNEIYQGQWAEPNEASLIKALREVHADPAEAQARGALSAVRAKLFTWKAAGRLLVTALREHGFLAEGLS